MRGESIRWWYRGVGVLSLVAPVLVACGDAGGASGGHDGTTDPSSSGTTETAPGMPPAASADDPLAERPWEIVSNKGETFVSNVFYADDSENEQVMPWAIDGRAVIDRLIYPTLGNPNLYVKDDADDELEVVLRIEDDAIEHLAPDARPIAGSPLRTYVLKDTDQDGIAFFLGTHSARGKTDGVPTAVPSGGDVFRIKPTVALISPEPDDMPSAFRKRHTVRFVFDRAAMAGVPADLYDVRFEVRKAGKVYANVFETQYNAVRVFDHANDEYTALDVTDTQVSTAAIYHTLTSDKLDEFVSYVNGSTDPAVRNAAFVAFNGDLHNGGSPESIRTRTVAQTYTSEAKRVVEALKQLTLPIFLTPGNHDGYSATGHVPSAVASADDALGDSLQKVVGDQNQIAWPDFDWNAYQSYLDATKDVPGGFHRDLVTGRFTRKPGKTFSEAFVELPSADRNEMLYDGFHQWQKSYGPLYGSWLYGKNRYVSLNTYELRQHRRSGWGMYTVNYGGAMSEAQVDWLDRELARAKKADEDVALLMHHDPRGGHNGKDHGYYFPVLEYQSMVQSTVNYLMSEYFTPMVCRNPESSLSVADRESCAHDGLQEWMAADELDGSFNSADALMKRIIDNPQIRTLLIGHTHLHSMEVLREGDALVDGRASLGSEARDLAILRLTSLADLTSQKYGAVANWGWSVLHVTKQLGAPTVNRLTYYIHTDDGGFSKITTVDVDRTKHLDARDPTNPIDELFTW